MLSLLLLTIFLARAAVGGAIPFLVQQDGRAVPRSVFDSLEELARVVDIAYCVGTTGIQKPFQCLSRCNDFPGFELITTWNTGPLLSDSCGYIAVSHAPHKKRVIVAFRGTYSIANTIADLSTGHAEYAPFPSHGKDEICAPDTNTASRLPLVPQLLKQHSKRSNETEVCYNCTVHSGFLSSWRNTRCIIMPDVQLAMAKYPDYELTLVGHSLGGAVAALAALEFQARGMDPHVTTFGEPRIGNRELNDFIDRRFNLNATDVSNARFLRVTHVDDPVPLLPLEEWGYRMHAGEIYISKPDLPPTPSDLVFCQGDQDPECIAGGSPITDETSDDKRSHDSDERLPRPAIETRDLWSLPPRYRLWQLFFAHRDYFWRLGLCLPGGYPWEWNKHGHGNDTTVENDL